MNREKLIHYFLLVMVGCFVLLGCNSKDAVDEAAQRDFERRLREAQELARQIKEGSLFDSEELRLQKIQEPDNVCSFSTLYVGVDFGVEPDFRMDGAVVMYSDVHGIIYYYDIHGKQRYKMHQYGQHPSFGSLKTDGTQKYVFQDFEWVQTDEGLEKKINGIYMNNENDWLKKPQLVYTGPAEHPFLTNDDKTLIFKENNKFFMLDENLKKIEISEKEYLSLRDTRFNFQNSWKIKTSYQGILGIWITDLAEKNWVQIRDLNQELDTIMLIPKSYSLYCWGEEFAGIIEIRPADLPEYSFKLNQGQAKVGDLFNVYEKQVSPINQEVIGYHEDKLKSTLRVVRIVEDIYICEIQTKLYMLGVYKDDIAVSQNDKSVYGPIL
ncbi:MAG: hypothetical protein WBM02_01665 [bacterium]